MFILCCCWPEHVTSTMVLVWEKDPLWVKKVSSSSVRSKVRVYHPPLLLLTFLPPCFLLTGFFRGYSPHLDHGSKVRGCGTLYCRPMVLYTAGLWCFILQACSWCDNRCLESWIFSLSLAVKQAAKSVSPVLPWFPAGLANGAACPCDVTEV